MNNWMCEKLKLWVDDVRPAPEGYVWAKSVNEATDILRHWGRLGATIGLIDLDHDAGDYAYDGGDYIKILDWLERIKLDIPIRIHSMNPVGVHNMRAIIQKNGWTEVV